MVLLSIGGQQLLLSRQSMASVGMGVLLGQLQLWCPLHMPWQ
jgi:hypothetical protein